MSPITAKDQFDNVDYAYQGLVQFSSTDGQAVLPPNFQFQLSDAGTHAFASGAS
jgi:hypothetical protein